MAAGGSRVAVRRLDNHSLEIDRQIAHERQKETLKMEQDVLDLKECFDECQRLVVSQGDGLDKVEDHVGSARQNVEKGTGQLEAANRHAKSSRKWMLCACILVIVIGAILAIVISVTKK
eukprot:Hpha_TRINITY_DN13188_c0_g1::TRINITY_DN13188_c0_g1_i1::g.113345::m.113345